MIDVLSGQEFSKIDEFVSSFNQARLSNKNKWIVFRGVVDGKEVTIKSFGLWCQIFRVNGLDKSFPAMTSVTVWKESIRKGLL